MDNIVKRLADLRRKLTLEDFLLIPKAQHSIDHVNARIEEGGRCCRISTGG